MIGHIDTRKLTQGSMNAYVTKVESPTLFWVQTWGSRREVKRLEEEVGWTMRRDAKHSTLWPHLAKPGTLVAVRNGTSWRRGFVNKIDGKNVTINLGDWGKIVKKTLPQVYRLPERFHQAPWQAFACSLREIQPTGSTTSWPQKSRDIFRLLAEGEEATIRIRRPIGCTAVDVDLLMGVAGGIGRMDMKEALIYLGLATTRTDGHRPYPSV